MESERSFEFGPLVAAVVLGIVFAALSIISQGGSARGYTSVFLLLLVGGLGILGMVAGAVSLLIGRIGLGFELIASAILLPVAFLIPLLGAGLVNGEYSH